MDIKCKILYKNLAPDELVKKALSRNEGELTSTGALLVKTGKYTGRSPKDKYIVDTEKIHDKISWGNINRPIGQNVFDSIKKEIINYLSDKEVFVFDGFAGADKKYQRKFRIINELASQNLFIRNLLIRPTIDELNNFGEPDWVIFVAPGCKLKKEKFNINSEVAVIINYESHEAVIAGTQYAGEIKKTVFSIMNYVMPIEENILPMHCSANLDPKTKETAIFFGLSGTGKTTLSADQDRKLIGDDEHGWSDDGIFNFEGGCYAKCINLKEENEPQIFNAIKKPGTILENVVMNKNTKVCDYADISITENTRAGYPIDFIDNSEISGVGFIPKVVIFLTADAFGVFPPVSKLTRNAALYHFVTGFTSKVAGTERGVVTPEPTFSMLFGEPFMPLPASKYAAMLGERLDKYDTKVYLVNTGWAGGPYGVGSRIKLSYTRKMVTAILNGTIENTKFIHDNNFNLEVPENIDGVPKDILNPRNSWNDKDKYDETAHKLIKMFVENFDKKYKDMPAEIKNAGPKI